MTVLQCQNPRGVLVFRDEVMGLLTRWDKRDFEDERAYFLEGWNGNGSYTDFKIGRGLTHAPNICISLGGGIQPDKLRRYLYQAVNGNNDGLLQRFQLAVYPDEPTPADWELVDKYPNTDEKNRVFQVFETLANMDFTAHGATQTEHDKFPIFHFTPDGQAVFNEWLTDLQKEKLPREEMPLMAEHLGKYRSLMPSLALVFHLLGVADGSASGQVSRGAAQLAAGWCDYLESHARRIYSYATTPELESACVLAKRLHKLPNQFSARDVYRKQWQALGSSEEATAACELLVDKHWLKAVIPPPTQGRPANTRYIINPAVRHD